MKNNYQLVFAISGVKNSGKTSLIENLIPLLNERGYSVAVIKHDGHEFEPDVPGTDTWRHQKAGALGTVIFSQNQYMLVKKMHAAEAEQESGEDNHDQPESEEDHRAESPDPSRFLELFPEADFVLLEGFKYSSYPKLEIIRRGNSSESVCRGYNLHAVVSDYEEAEVREMLNRAAECKLSKNNEEPCYMPLDDVEKIAKYLIRLRMQKAAKACSLVILAGGQSSRMRRDKADLLWQGKPFLVHQIEKGMQLGIKDILISGYRGDSEKILAELEQDKESAEVSIRFVPDRVAGGGPLAGMEACFREARQERCLVLGVDTPLVSDRDLGKLLLKKTCILSAHGELQPLIGVYGRNLFSVIADILSGEKKSVKHLLDRIPYEVVEASDPELPLFNINRPEDYQVLLSGFGFSSLTQDSRVENSIQSEENVEHTDRVHG